MGTTQTNVVFGTPHYMSPEQAFGERDLDHRTDIWSLGVIGYECLTSVLPIVGDNFGQIVKALATGTIRPVEELARGIPVPVARLIGRMLQPRREDRPAHLGEVVEVMEQFTRTRAPGFGPPLIRGSDASLDIDGQVVASDPTLPVASSHRFEIERARKRAPLGLALGAAGAIAAATLGLALGMRTSKSADVGVAAGPRAAATPSTETEPNPATTTTAAPAYTASDSAGPSDASAETAPIPPGDVGARAQPGPASGRPSPPDAGSPMRGRAAKAPARANRPTPTPPPSTVPSPVPSTEQGVPDRTQGGIVEKPPF